MKTIPWILCLIFLGAAFFFYASDNRHEKAMARVQEQVAELEKAAAEQPAAPRNENEVSLGEKERGELIKLRGEVGQLRHDKQKLEQQLQQAARNQTDLLQKQEKQAAAAHQLDQQNQQVHESVVAVNNCISNLRMIDGAKQQWALENKQPAEALPVMQQLLPYFKDSTAPVCPSGGTYSVNAVNAVPTCSIPNHALPQ